MSPTPKIRVAVLYGGRSTEHEVSLRSAASVVRNLDPSRYEVIPISIDPRGNFHRQDLTALRAASHDALPSSASTEPLQVSPRPGDALFCGAGVPRVDVVFPVMHGPLCEDGSIQGLLELADVPYVGSRVLGSAVSMDKDVAKRLVRAEGIPVVPYLCCEQPAFRRDRAALIGRVRRELGATVFVKPATLGSSVGVSRAQRDDELIAAIELAFRYDDKLLVERAVDAREIEVAVLAPLDPADPPAVTVPGEIVPEDAFYNFERKYLQATGASLHVPADLDATTTRTAQQLARRIFLATACEGMARVDFFLDKRSGDLFFNETNTIPGFTAMSMYPKLWEASGLPYARLLDRLIDHAIERHARKARLQRAR